MRKNMKGTAVEQPGHLGETAENDQPFVASGLLVQFQMELDELVTQVSCD